MSISSHFFCFAFLFCAPFISLQASPDPKITYHNMPGVFENKMPFSSAVQVGHTLYISGSLGNIPGKNQLVVGGIEAETRQTMENIKTTALRFGSSMSRVVKCTIFMASMGEWQAMNKIYVSYFEQLPARSAVAVSGLGLGARVEIDCIAIVGGNN